MSLLCSHKVSVLTFNGSVAGSSALQDIISCKRKLYIEYTSDTEKTIAYIIISSSWG